MTSHSLGKCSLALLPNAVLEITKGEIAGEVRGLFPAARRV